jgi:hypothetical protein
MAALVHPLITPFEEPLEVQQGATFRYTKVWYTKDDGTGVVTPVNLTNCTARARFWDSKGAYSPAFDLTGTLVADGYGSITLGGSTGEVTLHITPKTKQLDPIRSGWYSAEITFPDNDIVRLMQGPFSVLPRGASDV